MAVDSSTEITQQPQPTETEIQFILDAIAKYLVVEVRRSDVQSAWSGIRPLAQDPHAHSTESASRDHVTTLDTDGMITVTGKPLCVGLHAAVLSTGYNASLPSCRTRTLHTATVVVPDGTPKSWVHLLSNLASQARAFQGPHARAWL